MEHLNPTRQYTISRREWLENQLLATEATINGLHQTAFDLRSSLNSTTLIQSMLPLEIMAKIFTLVVSSSYVGLEGIRHPIPLKLGKICRAWRDIAWSTTALWETLDVVFLKNRSSMQQELLGEWLTRLGSHPVDLSIRSSLDFWGGHPSGKVPAFDPPRETFRVLLSSSKLWKTLKVLGGPYNNLRAEMLEQRSHLKFPILSSIHLNRDKAEWSNLCWHFQHTPLLHFVHLHGTAGAPTYQIEWGTLTRIEVEFSLPDSLYVLRMASPSLESANITLLDSDTRFVAGLHQVPNLKVLSTTGPKRATALFLNNMTSPALCEMELQATKETLEALVNLIHRSQCQLTNLDLHHPKIDEEKLIEALKQMPTLTSLSILAEDTVLFSDAMLQFLDCSLFPLNECLPRLTYLEYSGKISFQPKAMIKALRARGRHCGRAIGDSEDGDSMELLASLDISYTNVEWSNDKNPNSVQELHAAHFRPRNIAGTQLTFAWSDDDRFEEPSDSDSGSESDQ